MSLYTFWITFLRLAASLLLLANYLFSEYYLVYFIPIVLLYHRKFSFVYFISSTSQKDHLSVLSYVTYNQVREVCKLLKVVGIHTVSLHSAASIDPQIHGLVP